MYVCTVLRPRMLLRHPRFFRPNLRHTCESNCVNSVNCPIPIVSNTTFHIAFIALNSPILSSFILLGSSSLSFSRRTFPFFTSLPSQNFTVSARFSRLASLASTASSILRYRYTILPLVQYRYHPLVILAAIMPSPLSPANQPKNPELVKVSTALTVLSQINLLAESSALALDIGGSLAKLIYLQPHTASKPTPPPLKIHLVDGSVATALSVRVPVLHGTLHFFAVETINVHKLLRFIREHWKHSSPPHRYIRATGGGAFKYADTFKDEIDVTLARLDELKCTVTGLNFLLTSVDNEVYVHNGPLSARVIPPSIPDLASTREFVESTEHPFPYLLVNIGSGVSIVKVTDHDCYERISGSSLGGGTFWGLARLLLNCETFEDVINLTHSGDSNNVDMLVGDIYGGSYESIGLDAGVIAASFGKATMREDFVKQPASTLSNMWHLFKAAVSGTANLWMSFMSSVPGMAPILRRFGYDDDSNSSPMVTTSCGDEFRPQDVALSLLRMLSYNVGQIAHLNARVHGLDRIYFGGNFIRDHPYTIADISYAVDFWSGGDMKALFLRHDGYLGAIGAFIGASSSAPKKILEEVQSKKVAATSVASNCGDVQPSSVQAPEVAKVAEVAEVSEVIQAAEVAEASELVQAVEVAAAAEVAKALRNRHASHNDDVSVKTSNASDASGMEVQVNGVVPNGSVVGSPEHGTKPVNGKNLTSTGKSSMKTAVTNGASKSSKRRRASTRAKTSNDGVARDMEMTHGSDNGTSHLQGRPVLPADDPDGGEWTTVTRIRRRGGAKDRLS